MVNTSTYGGGAVYNIYSMTCVDHKVANQVFVHEFAHGLAGLADEYGNDPTYQDMYPPDVEPWEPNLTTMINFESKWKNLIEPDTQFLLLMKLSIKIKLEYSKAAVTLLKEFLDQLPTVL